MTRDSQGSRRTPGRRRFGKSPQRDTRRPRRPQRRDTEHDDSVTSDTGTLTFPPCKTGRQAALATLLSAVSSREFVNDHLERTFTNSELPDVERRLATELAFGVVRRHVALDSLIENAVTRPRHNVEHALWMLLRLGAYQLAFCESIPPHAACDETVELARWLGSPQWVSFANGVLRGIGRMFLPDPIREPSAKALPTTGGHFRRLAKPVFPDPLDKPLAYVSKAFSLPSWLVTRWSNRFDFAELCRLGFWFNTPTPLCLRVNRLRTTRETLLSLFAEHQIAARPGDLPTSVWLSEAEPTVADDESLATAGRVARSNSTPRVDRLPGFDDGYFVVQDESAQRAAELLAPQPGETVLDLCAAPGTKTTHLAELMQNQGRLVATDTSESRLRLVADNSRRLGITIVESAVISSEATDIPAGPFDAILIDAPCSNTGVLGKRPDARWRIQPEDLEELSRIQLRLLLAAADRLRPGGRLVYSTCSIEPEENQQVVEAACHFRPQLQLAAMNELVPGRPADGGFQCLLRLP